MTLIADNARQILLEALSSDFGIVIEIEPLEAIIAPALRAKQVLYRFKQEDIDFSNIQIRLSPDDPDRELWLVKQNG